MATINFRKKISFTRPYTSRKDPEGEYFITRHFESDRGRIINSAAIRRLQQKPCFRWSGMRPCARA